MILNEETSKSDQEVTLFGVFEIPLNQEVCLRYDTMKIWYTHQILLVTTILMLRKLAIVWYSVPEVPPSRFPFAWDTYHQEVNYVRWTSGIRQTLKLCRQARDTDQLSPDI